MEPDPYPEVESAGTLLGVFRDVLGPDVHLEERGAWPGRNVVLRGGDRSVDITLGAAERLFSAQYWAARARYTSSKTADLAAAAGAARDWVSGATTRAMNATWAFVEFGAWAEACERGEGIEFRWQSTFAHRHLAGQLVPLSRFIELAMDEPRLRALFPFTSHSMLGFRHAPGIGPSLGVWVTPEPDGRFVVRDPQRREVRVPDAESAVAEVLNLLRAPA